MARTAVAILQDIVDAAGAIRTYTRGGRGAFAADAMVRDAVIARLIQIGQAVKDVRAAGAKLDELWPEIPWQKIAGMRDRLAHRYWEIEADLIWAVVNAELPKVVAAVRQLSRAMREPKRRRTRK